MDMSQDFEGRYLKASNYEEGESLTLTIKSVTREEFEDRDTHEKIRKAVVYFHEKKPGLVVNKTNGETLLRLFGKDSDDWLGQAVKMLVVGTPKGMSFKISDKRVAAPVVVAKVAAKDEAPL